MVLLAGKISGFLSDCSSGAVWGDHCSNSCSLMKIQGYKSRVLKYRCTRPGNIVERQKVHFGSSLLEWNSSLCLKTNHFIYKICSLVIIMLTALWKTAQNLAWHLFACFFFSHIYYPGETNFELYDSVYYECGEPLEKVQRICGCPNPGSVQGQGAWDLEQTGQVKCVQVGESELNDLWGSSQLKPRSILSSLFLGNTATLYLR